MGHGCPCGLKEILFIRFFLIFCALHFMKYYSFFYTCCYRLFRRGHGVYELHENEIHQTLMGDNSDEEDNLVLDEEDQRI